jgi:hypothetical protein
VIGVNLRGFDNNVLTQVGFVVLIALAAKNAILIVEFAKQAEEQDGMAPADAAIHAPRTRLRPILMTSLAFILGSIPLVFATGAGAELRQALGTAVFSGMIGVTVFGLRRSSPVQRAPVFSEAFGIQHRMARDPPEAHHQLRGAARSSDESGNGQPPGPPFRGLCGLSEARWSGKSSRSASDSECAWNR